jgi:hypothetical protein
MRLRRRSRRCTVTRSTVSSRAASGSRSPSTRSVSEGRRARRRPPSTTAVRAVARGRAARAQLAARPRRARRSARQSSTIRSTSTCRMAQLRPVVIATTPGRRCRSGPPLARTRQPAPGSSSAPPLVVYPCPRVLRRRTGHRVGTRPRQALPRTQRLTPSPRPKLPARCQPSRRRLAAAHPSRAGAGLPRLLPLTAPGARPRSARSDTARKKAA